MSEFVKWFLIILFGVMFMGFEFFLYVFVCFVVFMLIVIFYPNWLNGL